MWTAGRFRAPRSGSPSLSRGLAVTNNKKSHRPGAQTTHIQFSPSGGWEPEIQAPTDSGPREAPFSLSSRGREPALVSSSSIRALRPSWGPRLQTPSHWGSGPRHLLRETGIRSITPPSSSGGGFSLVRPRRPAASRVSFQSGNPPCSSRWEACIDSPVEKPRPGRFSLPPLARPCPSQGAQNLPVDLPFRTYGL